MKAGIQYLDELDDKCFQITSLGGDFIHVALESILELGFKKVLYYDFCHQECTSDSYFVLKHIYPKESRYSRYIGKRLKSNETRFLKLNKKKNNDARLTPIFCPKKNIKNCVNVSEGKNSLKFEHYNTVSSPVYAGDVLIGKLTCVWESGVTFECNKPELFFSRVASILQKHMRLLIRNKIKVIIDGLNNLTFGYKNREEILNCICQNACKSLDGVMASAFSYDWYHKTLVKTNEYSKDNPKAFPEEYLDGTSLTSLAYNDSRYHFLVNLERVRDKGNLVNEKSFDRHTQLLGRINCIAYGCVGTNENRVLIRVFNKTSEDGIPFNELDLLCFKEICRDMSDMYNNFCIKIRLKNLQQVANTALREFSNLQRLSELLCDKLRDEWIKDIVFLYRDLNEANITVSVNTIDILNSSNPKNNITTEWNLDSNNLLNKVIRTSNVKYFSIDEAENDPLQETLAKNNIAGLFAFPIQSGSLKSVLAIPIVKKGSTLDAFEKDVPAAHLELITAYASILNGAMSIDKEKLTKEGAVTLMGHIGHEIKSPTIELANQATTICRKIKSIVEKVSFIREKGDIDIQDIDSRLKKIADYKRGLQVIVNLAQNVTLASDKNIETNFRYFSLFALIKECENLVVKESSTLQGERGVRINFKYNSALVNAGEIVGDWFLLFKVFENVFRNAVKYSAPPGNNRPIVISVHANPQPKQLRLLITNQGTPIPYTDSEKIFSPYYRIGYQDGFHATRGMGMGLYVARTFALLHNGNVRLLESTPTLSHRNKIRDVHKWKTTFEVKFSREIQPTPKTVTIKK